MNAFGMEKSGRGKRLKRHFFSLETQRAIDDGSVNSAMAKTKIRNFFLFLKSNDRFECYMQRFCGREFNSNVVDDEMRRRTHRSNV